MIWVSARVAWMQWPPRLVIASSPRVNCIGNAKQLHCDQRTQIPTTSSKSPKLHFCAMLASLSAQRWQTRYGIEKHFATFRLRVGVRVSVCATHFNYRPNRTDAQLLRADRSHSVSCIRLLFLFPLSLTHLCTHWNPNDRCNRLTAPWSSSSSTLTT